MLASEYKDVTIEFAIELRNYDPFWAFSIADDGSKTDLLEIKLPVR